MTIDFYRTRDIKKTRKKHWCTGCLEDIKAGSPAVYVSCVWEGEFQRYYLCPECHAFTDTDAWRDAMTPNDGWSEGDIGELRKDKEAVE